ncbi:MAG: hypothetical protein ACOCV8_00205 [Spirochaetota bacterium]
MYKIKFSIYSNVFNTEGNRKPNNYDDDEINNVHIVILFNNSECINT